MPEGLGAKRRHDDDDETGQHEKEESERLAAQASDTSHSAPASPADADSSGLSATNAALSSSLGSRLLAKAGYKGEGGLGKREQGAASLLPDSTQLSTHGIGFQTAAKRQHHTFTPQHHISIRITPAYLPPPTTAVDTSALHPTLAPHDDTQRRLTSPNYGSLAAQHELQAAKSFFDHIDHRSFLSARQRANPFELIKGEMFQNRAALKMAELDAITGRMFTTLPATAAQPALFHFADVCAGPGGFSEYMLTRWKWRAKGYGFTLRTPPATDFLPHKFNSNTPAHSFRGYYGVDGTGDITSTANVRRLAEDMRAEVSEGVHVCTADGGFDVTGAEDKQELLSQQLILCECITALSVVRVGGHFACKLFDCFLPFTVSLLWVMWRCWDSVAIIKPNQSRPANSERFLVCRGRKSEDDMREWREYLVAVNEMIEEQKTQRKSNYKPAIDSGQRSGSRDEAKEEVRASEREADRSEEVKSADDQGDDTDMAVVCCVPEEVVMADVEFMSYMRQSNDDIAQRQVNHQHTTPTLATAHRTVESYTSPHSWLATVALSPLYRSLHSLGSVSTWRTPTSRQTISRRFVSTVSAIGTSQTPENNTNYAHSETNSATDTAETTQMHMRTVRAPTAAWSRQRSRRTSTWDTFTTILSGVTITSHVIRSRACSLCRRLSSCCLSWTSSCILSICLSRCRLRPRRTRTGDIRRVSTASIRS